MALAKVSKLAHLLAELNNSRRAIVLLSELDSSSQVDWIVKPLMARARLGGLLVIATTGVTVCGRCG